MSRYTPRQRINLAMSAMRGNPEAYRRLGIERKDGAIGELDAIVRDAMGELTPGELTEDEAQTVRELNDATNPRPN